MPETLDTADLHWKSGDAQIVVDAWIHLHRKGSLIPSSPNAEYPGNRHIVP